MSFIIIVLTFLLIVNSGVLVLLILVQLPKKDAGAGLAFGGGTADALFGAGSGNALTKITKWATVVFVALAVILSSVETKTHKGSGQEFETGVEQKQQQTQSPGLQPPTAPAQSAPQGAASAPVMPLLSATNTPTAPANGK